MKKIQKIFAYKIITLLFLLSGCVNSHIKEDDTLTIKFDFTSEPKNIHEIGLINDVQVLNLDCDESIFGIVDKIIRYNNRIYLMDKWQTKSVTIYDTLGNFVGLISKHGQGPNEYLQLTDIFIDPLDTTLNVVSRIDRKILKYDLDGSHLRGIAKLPKSFSNLTNTKDGYIGYMGNYGEEKSKAYNVWTMSRDLQPEHWFFPINPTWESKDYGGRSIFSTYKDNLYYLKLSDFNIYKIDKNILTVPYTFDLGKAGLPVSYTEDYEEMRRIGRENRYIMHFDNFQETDNHLIIDVIYKGQRLLGVYNKHRDESYIAKLEVYMDKYFFGFGQIIGFDEKAIYTLIEASRMKDIWNGKNEYNDFESKYPEQIKRLREKFPVVKEDGNPFLVIYSIN